MEEKKAAKPEETKALKDAAKKEEAKNEEKK